MTSKSLLLASQSKTNPKAVCHSIPCKVNTDSEAKVDTYFEPTITKSEKDSTVLLSSFRGRPLIGRSIALPDSCRAFVISEKSEQLVAQKSIDRFVHWNLDKIPSESDSLPQLVEWLRIAEAIHSSIDFK